MYWLVTVEKIASGARKQRRIRAVTTEAAGDAARALIAGPAIDLYRVVSCIPETSPDVELLT